MKLYNPAVAGAVAFTMIRNRGGHGSAEAVLVALGIFVVIFLIGLFIAYLMER
jgi:hypothetical protein